MTVTVHSFVVISFPHLHVLYSIDQSPQKIFRHDKAKVTNIPVTIDAFNISYIHSNLTRTEVIIIIIIIIKTYLYERIIT